MAPYSAQFNRPSRLHHSHACFPDKSRLPAQVLLHSQSFSFVLHAVCNAQRCMLQVHSLLRHWRHQSDHPFSDCRLCRRHLKHDHSKQPAQLRQFARKEQGQRLSVAVCASESFSDSNVVAGIPVSAANTTAGQCLWQTLQHQQLAFVSEVKQCLQELAAQGLSSPVQDGQEEGILVSTRRKALLEDVLYYWAVAEAYLTDASLQASFR